MTRPPLPTDNRYLQQIAPTPLVPVRLEVEGPEIFCKLEFLNPSGSTKDRIARYMLEKAWRSGQVAPGGKVVEASSGSTSIALAMACAQMGLHFTAVLPAGVSSERQLMIRAYGGDIRWAPADSGIVGAIQTAREFAEESGAFYTRQFENPDNAEAHHVWTGQEILAQIPGGVVHAVASGVGTGGTIVGLYAAFVGAGSPVTPVAARPVGGVALGGVECCSFSPRVPGVMDGGVSKLFDPAALPGLIELDISDDAALDTTRALILRGFPVGPSSGLNYAAAVEAQRLLGPAARVVTVFPDRMERYFSTELFADAR